MDRLTLAAIVITAVIFLWGFYLWTEKAYAETFEDVIRIPIPDDVTGTEKKSKLTQLTDDLLEFTVTYRFHTSGNFTEWREEILLDEGIRPPDVTICPEGFYLDEDGITCYPIYAKPLIIDPEIVKTRELIDFEKDLTRLEDKAKLSIAEKEYYALLQSLSLCQRGENEASPVQTKEEYVVSQTWIDPHEMFAKSFELTGRHANLKMAVEECKAQRTILEPVVLGRQYLDLSLVQNYTQPYHGDVGVKSGDPLYSQSRVNQEANQGIDTTKDYCDEVVHLGLETKRYLGCIDEPDADKPISKERLQDMCNSSYVMPSFKRSNGCTLEQIAIYCYACERQSTEYESEIYGAYSYYVNIGDDAQKKKILAEIAEERAAEVRANK